MAAPLVMTVYGTRPEAVKMAPLVAAIEASDALSLSVVVTGQHREMLDQVNARFGIQPDADLDIGTPGQSLADIATATLTGLDAVLARVQPDVVVVQGDTSTAAVAALAAFYRRIPVVHLEAGLRSGDLASPFPEEGNRKIVGQLAALHLPPTEHARQALLREGVHPDAIAVTGNTVIDALLHAVELRTPFSDPRVAAAVASERRLVVVTAHRRESWASGLASTAEGIARIAARDDVCVVLPMHRNPIVRAAVEPHLAHLEHVVLTEPMDYGEFTQLLAAAHVIVTDSGGVQEEAPSLGRPVLVTRDTTERPEAVAAGAVRLIGTDASDVEAAIALLLDDDATHAAMSRAVNPYGDGRAAERAVAAIAELLGVGSRLPDFAA